MMGYRSGILSVKVYDCERDTANDMSAESDIATSVGLASTIGWTIGGFIGGAIGSAVLGLVLWVADPAIIDTIVPAAYGFDSNAALGWSLHLIHGGILGLVFGGIVTRSSVLGMLRSEVATPLLSRTGLHGRMMIAGFVYGLAVWAILPVLVVPIWTGVILDVGAGAFPALALESLFGHLLFGLVLGLVFGLVVNLDSRSSSDPFDEPTR